MLGFTERTLTSPPTTNHFEKSFLLATGWVPPSERLKRLYKLYVLYAGIPVTSSEFEGSWQHIKNTLAIMKFLVSVRTKFSYDSIVKVLFFLHVLISWDGEPRAIKFHFYFIHRTCYGLTDCDWCMQGKVLRHFPSFFFSFYLLGILKEGIEYGSGGWRRNLCSFLSD